jgi:hypothetical protein
MNSRRTTTLTYLEVFGLGIAMDATFPQTLLEDFWPKIQGMFIGGQTV